MEKFGANQRGLWTDSGAKERAQEKGPRWGEEDLFVFPLGLDVLMMLAMRPRMMAMILSFSDMALFGGSSGSEV